MTKHLTLLLFIGLAWGQKQYNIEHIVEQGGVHKKKFSDEPVNGEVFKMVGDLKVPLGSMKNGKKDGTWVLWNNDGTKSEEKSYKNGEKDGTWTYWFDNGQKKEELSYKSGKRMAYLQNGMKIVRFLKKGHMNQILWLENGNS